MTIKPESFERRINAYFERYQTTTQILESLLNQRAAPQDFIVLTCARLDSLANHATPGRQSQSDKFAKLLLRHSGHQSVFEKVSVPDLYASLLVELWQLPGVVNPPGKLRMFDELRQRDFLDMYWKSDLPLIEDDLGKLLMFLLDCIREQYRVIPYQRRKKPTLKASGTCTSISNALRSSIGGAHTVRQ